MRTWTFRSNVKLPELEGSVSRCDRLDTRDALEITLELAAHQDPVRTLDFLPDGGQRVLADVNAAKLRVSFVQDGSGMQLSVAGKRVGRGVETLTCPWALMTEKTSAIGRTTLGPDSLSKNLIPDFSTNSLNPGPHPNRSAQTSIIAIGFLAALNRSVMSEMTCWRTGFVERLFSCCLDEVEEGGRGGAECG